MTVNQRKDPPLHIWLAGAADVLQGVREGRSQSDQLGRLDPLHKPAIQSMSSTALRRWGVLQSLRELMFARAPRVEIECMVDIGLSELISIKQGLSQRTAHTLVDQAVAALDHLLRQSGPAARQSARGLTNAVLRRFLREGDALLAQVAEKPLARNNVPLWWSDKLRQQYPAQLDLAQASLASAPMTLRVNTSRVSVKDYGQRLHDAAIAHRHLADNAICLTQAVAVEQLPGFEQGDCSVQDLGAQMSARFLLSDEDQTHFLRQANTQAALRVLDACAAPGGKTGHLLETLLQQNSLHPDRRVQVWAIDNDVLRVSRVESNLRRLGWPLQNSTASRDQIEVTLVHGDAANLASLPTTTLPRGQMFDRILLDAPCSASGIVARHPDIPWLRRASDMAGLVAQQRRLLEALWSRLVPGGTLLYVSCSLFHEENQAQVAAFVHRHPECQVINLPLIAGEHDNLRAVPRDPGLQLLPNSAGELTHDGFYYALLQKNKTLAPEPVLDAAETTR